MESNCYNTRNYWFNNYWWFYYYKSQNNYINDLFMIICITLQTEVKVEASAVKQLLEEGVDEGEEVSLLHSDHAPIMIRGEDGVLYQVIITTT